MHKVFQKHPPEQLREDLPSLQEFDSIYRHLKEISDKLVDLQPEKVNAFLHYVGNQKHNAFTMYLMSLMKQNSILQSA